MQMQKEVARAVGLIVLGMITSLAACQSGGSSSSKSAQITDPNAVFAQGGAQTSSANGTTGGAPSRRGRGLFRGPGVDSGGP
jgi:hypothetical protein